MAEYYLFMKQRIRTKRRNQMRRQSQPYLAKVDDLPKGYDYPFEDGDTVLMLGEINQMPGHVAIVTKDGKTHFGYHAENFRKLTKEEA